MKTICELKEQLKQLNYPNNDLDAAKLIGWFKQEHGLRIYVSEILPGTIIGKVIAKSTGNVLCINHTLKSKPQLYTFLFNFACTYLIHKKDYLVEFVCGNKLVKTKFYTNNNIVQTPVGANINIDNQTYKFISAVEKTGKLYKQITVNLIPYYTVLPI